jgi:hypothetical protein
MASFLLPPLVFSLVLAMSLVGYTLYRIYT